MKSEQIRKNLIAYLRKMPLEKGLEIRIVKSGKTPPQRAYWHSMLRLIASDAGVTETALKEQLKADWLPLREHKRPDGKIVLIPKSTEDLTKEDYSVLIEKTLALAAFLEITIPSPDYYGM